MEAYAAEEEARELERHRIAREQSMRAWGSREYCIATLCRCIVLDRHSLMLATVETAMMG